MSTSLSAPVGEYRFEPEKIKGSRFIACLALAANEEEAEAFVRKIRAEFDDARHVCWAWRIGDEGERVRSSDDGEPPGSAGRPILAQLEGHDVIHCVVAVVRYFGGVKLGVGGLVRAYGGAAGKCLDRCKLAPVILTTRLQIEHGYSCSRAVEAAMHHLGLTALEPEFGQQVRFFVEVPRQNLESFRRELVERTAGQVRIDENLRQDP
jgi:uncharacterized YigZ family protein